MATAVDAIKSELAGIEEKLSGYEQLVEQRDRLSAALNVLEGQGYPAQAQRHSRASRASSAPFDEAAIVHTIHVHGGPASATEIRDALSIPEGRSNAFSQKLKQMVDAGVLGKQGERRATRYTAKA